MKTRVEIIITGCFLYCYTVTSWHMSRTYTLVDNSVTSFLASFYNASSG